MNAKDVLAKNLRLLMDQNARLGTQTALASKSGLSQATIANLLRGDFSSQPRLDNVEAAAAAFGLTTAALLDTHLFSPETARFSAWMADVHASLIDDPARLEAFTDLIDAAVRLVQSDVRNR